MKIILFLLLSILYVSPLLSQGSKKDSEIEFFAGPSMYRIKSYNFKNGYRIGASLKDRIDKTIYRTIQFSFGEDDGTYRTPEKWIEKSTIRDIQLNIGLGLNILQGNNNRLFLQATVGGSAIMGSETSTEAGRADVQSTRKNNQLGLSATISAGYKHYFFNRIGLGLGYDYIYLHNIGNIHSLNGSLSIKL